MEQVWYIQRCAMDATMTVMVKWTMPLSVCPKLTRYRNLTAKLLETAISVGHYALMVSVVHANLACSSVIPSRNQSVT